HRIRESREPRMAIQAAAGAMPNEKPRTRCENDVNRLVKEYTNTIVRARGASCRHNGFKAHDAAQKTKTDAATKAQPKVFESCPAGIWRILVRGFSRSISASSRRLKAIAAERA